MKKNSAARTHIVSELGPAAAAVAVQRRLKTATMLNSTRSRRVRTRGSSPRGDSTGAASDTALIRSPSLLEVEALRIQDVTQQAELALARRRDFGQTLP